MNWRFFFIFFLPNQHFTSPKYQTVSQKIKLLLFISNYKPSLHVLPVYCGILPIHLSIWLCMFYFVQYSLVHQWPYTWFTTNMTVIWDNCDIPSQLDTRSFLIPTKYNCHNLDFVITPALSSGQFSPLDLASSCSSFDLVCFYLLLHLKQKTKNKNKKN